MSQHFSPTNQSLVGQFENGAYLAACGGLGSMPSQKACKTLNLDTMEWKFMPEMPSTRALFTLTHINGQDHNFFCCETFLRSLIFRKLFAIGGHVPDFAIRTNMEVFDLSTGEWTSKELFENLPEMDYGVVGHCTIPVGDELFIIGGDKVGDVSASKCSLSSIFF